MHMSYRYFVDRKVIVYENNRLPTLYSELKLFAVVMLHDTEFLALSRHLMQSNLHVMFNTRK
jgi:hypothetical protein